MLLAPQFKPSALAAYPHLVEGLLLDLDAAKGITLNGSDVAAWADQSGNLNHLAQSSAALQPVYTAANPHFRGKPSVDFHKSAGEYLFGASLPICTALSGSDKPMEVFLVCRRSTKVTAAEDVVGLGNSGSGTNSYIGLGWNYASSTSQRPYLRVREDGATVQTLMNGQPGFTDLAPQVMIWSLTGTAAAQYAVGGSQAPLYDAARQNLSSTDYSAQGAITFDRFSVGVSLRSTPAAASEAEVARLLVYDRQLTDAERLKIAAHLYDLYCRPRISDPTDLGATHWWDASQLAGAAGSDVDTWEDLVGSLDFSASGFDAPIVALHDNGRKTVLFQGTDDAMDSAAASDGNFLHNGSSATLAVVYRVEAADEALQPILDTNGGSTTARGFSLAHDGASGAHSLQTKIGNGSANVVNHDSQDGGSRPGAWHVAVFVHQNSVPSTENNYHFWLDGEHYVAVDLANAESASDAVGPITLGRFVGGAYGKVQIAEIVAFDTALGSPGEIVALSEYLATKWNTSHVSLVAGNGLAGILEDTEKHRAFPGLLHADGRWLCAYRRAVDHGSSAGVCCLKESSDGRQWTPERVIFDDTANFDWRGVNYFGQISTGRIFIGMKLSETDSDLLPYTAGVLYSDDGGHSWQGPLFLSKATDAWHNIFTGGLTYDEGVNSIVELGDGTLLAHFMALVNGAVRTHIVQCKSFDGGKTWTEPTILYYGRQPGLGDFPQDERIQEPCVVRFADGELLMAIRADTPNERIYFARDLTGTGDNWTPSAFTTQYVAGWGNPRMIVDPANPNGVWLFHRLNSGPNLAVWRYSADRGVTWSDPEPLTNLNDNATTGVADYGTGMTYCYPARDAAGNVWVAWGMEVSEDGDIFMRRWADAPVS